VRLIELLRHRDEVEIGLRRKALADGSAAAADGGPRRVADVHRAEDAGFTRRHADHGARGLHGGAIDELDRSIAGQPQLDVDAIGGAVELGHVTPGDDQGITVGPSKDPGPLRRIEVGEDRRDPRRSGQEPGDVPIGTGVILGDEGDVAVGIEKGFAVSAQ
jgi:hypothetical protein